MKHEETPKFSGPRAYSISKFCELFSVSRSFVYSRISDGTLNSVRIAGRRLIPADTAEALIAATGDGERRGSENG